MAQLLVRHVDDTIVENLKIKAAKKGVSAEELHRDILKESLGLKRKSLAQVLQEIPSAHDESANDNDVFERIQTKK